MTSLPLHIVHGGLTGSASLDTAVSRSILHRVSNGELPELLQVGQPHKVVAFGRHDAVTEGFDGAVQIAIEHGFDPTVRIAGGRAVVFHPHVVRFAWTVPSADPIVTMGERFTTVAEHVLRALATLGVTASIGQLHREYCPGSHSVHINGGGKVMGSGQRLTRNAAQVGGMIVVGDPALINEALEPIYASLRLDMDPRMTGALADVAHIDPEAVATAFSQQFASGRETLQSGIDETTMALAREYQPEHDPRTAT